MVDSVSRQAQELAAESDFRSRIMAVVARIARVYPEVAGSIAAKQVATNNLATLKEFADEAERVQAALILGLACTEKGNNIHHENIDSLSVNSAMRDRTGAIKALYQGRES